MPQPFGDPLTHTAFSIFENKGVYALLLGSGVSRASEIPTGWEITLDLVRRIGEAEGAQPQADWEAWYRERSGTAPDYSHLVTELGRTSFERRSILHSYIEPTAQHRQQGKRLPTSAHKAIARLVAQGYIKVIITTNFDRLLETALEAEGVTPTVVADSRDMSGAEPLVHSNCYVFKVHGDYMNSRIRNTDHELSKYPPAFKKLLKQIFDEFGLIICGWSGEWDDALREAITQAPGRRYTTFWAVRGELKQRANDLVHHRKAITIQIESADDFFRNLEKRVEALAQNNQQNPLGVEFLVASAKRFVAHPEHQIQLEDLISDALSEALRKIETGVTFSSHASTSDIQGWMTTYEAATEPLARIVGVLGRWGQEAETARATDIIRALAKHADGPQNGSIIALSFRLYPAVLCFTAYGLSLTRQKRWHDLHAFLKHTEDMISHEGTKSLASWLFLNSWEAGQIVTWNTLLSTRSRTPLSIHRKRPV